MIETDKGYRLVGEKDPSMCTVFSGSDFSGGLSFNGFPSNTAPSTATTWPTISSALAATAVVC